MSLFLKKILLQRKKIFIRKKTKNSMTDSFHSGLYM